MEFSPTWQNKIQISRTVETSADYENTADKTDAQLIEAILAGEELAFENLFDRYKRLVASIAGRYFQRPEEIEEIIQISFAKVYFELKSFRGEFNFSFAGWIGKIATNACLDALRSQKRKPENLWCEFSDAESEKLFALATHKSQTAENLMIDRDLAEKLLSRLAPADRALLQMLDVEELTVREAVDITGWSAAKIKIRAFRARKALRQILRKYL